MSGGDDRRERGVNVWKRWTDEEEVPFHGYCVLRPVDVQRLWPPEWKLEREPEVGKPALSYCPSVPRWVLRHTPFVVLLATLVFAFQAYGPFLLQTGGRLLGFVTWPSLAVVAVMLAWLAVLFRLLREVAAFPGTGTVQATVVHVFAVGLTAGVVLGLYAAGPDAYYPGLSSELEAAVTSFPFAFLWMLLLGGHLVYDGMLRTEYMFSHLHEKHRTVVDDVDAYQTEFLDEFRQALTHRTRFGERLPGWSQDALLLGRIPGEVRTCHLFAFLFVVPFFAIWWLAPTDPGVAGGSPVRAVVALVPTVLDFFLVVVFFQFVVLITYFNTLLADHGPEDADASFTLEYQPGHPDEYAGFRDFGRFATRVNVLLLVGGIYVGYRLYVGGIESFAELDPGVTVETVAWGINHLGPLAFYVFAVVLWLYLSFWQIHKTMRRGREREIERRATEEASEPGSDLQNAPVWPVDQRVLFGLVSADLLPLLGLLPFVPT